MPTSAPSPSPHQPPSPNIFPFPSSPHIPSSPVARSPVDPTTHSPNALYGPPEGALATSHVGSYTLYGTIGEGAFGKVKIAVDRRTNVRVAVKIMDKAEIRAQQFTAQVRREIHVMRSLKHPHIVRLHEVLTSNTKLYIVMELVTGGELFAHIEQGPVAEQLARKYFQQLVDGVHFCHKSGVAHRDLKPENLLLDTNADIKITDFGFSSMKGMDVNMGLLYTQCGTPDYCAPEIIDSAHNGYSGAKVDAWSCGIILYFLLCGKLPFEEPETHKLYDLILACAVQYPPHLSPDARDLLQNLLVRDPDRRYDLHKVKRHPWFLVEYGGDDARAIKKAPFFKQQSRDLLSSSQPPSPAAPPSPSDPPHARPQTMPPLAQSSRVNLPAHQQSRPHTPSEPHNPDQLLPSHFGNPVAVTSPTSPPPHTSLPRVSGMSASPACVPSAAPTSAPYFQTVPSPMNINDATLDARVSSTGPGLQDSAFVEAADRGHGNAHAHPAVDRSPYQPSMLSNPHHPIPPAPLPHAVHHLPHDIRRVPPSTPPFYGSQPHTPVEMDKPTFAPSPAPGMLVSGASNQQMAPEQHHPLLGSTASPLPPALQSQTQHQAGGAVDSHHRHHPHDTAQDDDSGSESDSVIDYANKPAVVLELPGHPRQLIRKMTAEDSWQQSTSARAQQIRQRSDLAASSISRGNAVTGRPVTVGGDGVHASAGDLATSRRPRFARDGSVAPSLKDPRAVLLPVQSNEREASSVPPVVYSPSLAGGGSARSYEPFNSGSHGSLRRAEEAGAEDRLQSIKLPANHTMRGQRTDSTAPDTPGHAGLLSQHMWTMVAKLRGRSRAANPKMDDELREDMHVLMRELRHMARADAWVVLSQFLALFESQGLSPPEPPAANPQHAPNGRRHGGIVASASDTDMMTHLIHKMAMHEVGSEDESMSSVSLSPVVAEVTGMPPNDIARRRDVSDLLNQWIRSADQPPQEPTSGGSDGPPLQGPELVELHRLLRRYRSGREASNMADELLRAIQSGGGGEENGSQSMNAADFDSTKRSFDMNQSQQRFFSNVTNPSRSSTPVRSSSSNNIPLPSEYVPGRFQERTKAFGAATGATGNGGMSVGKVSGREDDSSPSADGSTGTTGTTDSRGEHYMRTSEMAHSMGLSNVAYYDSDKRNGMGNKLREVLHTMKQKNQRMGEYHAQFKSHVAPDDIMRVLGRVLQRLGAVVTIKRETKRKMKCQLPQGDGSTLHAGIEVNEGQGGAREVCYVSFRRSKADRGRTSTERFHSFFEEVRQLFIEEATKQFPWLGQSEGGAGAGGARRKFAHGRRRRREDGGTDGRGVDGAASSASGVSRELTDVVSVGGE